MHEDHDSRVASREIGGAGEAWVTRVAHAGATQRGREAFLRLGP